MPFPNQLMLHPSLEATTELILLSPPLIGIRKEADTNWYNIGLEGGASYVSTVYGEDFLLMNGRGAVRKREPNSTTVTSLPTFPQGITLATFANRIFIGGGIILGNKEPLGVVWGSAADAYNFNDPEGTAGFSLLISNDTIAGDRVVAFRPMNFNYMAILNRKSVWIGQVTGDATNPASFSPQVMGKGCVSEKTARLTYGGVMYLGDEGVELFDGNQCTHVSYQIDDAILPITATNIGNFSATYNPSTQFYYLFTPVGTFVYDCIRNRWHRRSMVAINGIPWALQFHATTWGEAVGNWGDQTTIWEDWNPEEQQVPDMFFLGDKANGDRVLAKEDMASSSMLESAVKFLWGSPFGEFEHDNYLTTHKGARIESINRGTVSLYLPNSKGVFESVRTGVKLPSVSTPDVTWIPKEHTGLGIGLQLEITDGDPRISQVELDYIKRGMRIVPKSCMISKDAFLFTDFTEFDTDAAFKAVAEANPPDTIWSGFFYFNEQLDETINLCSHHTLKANKGGVAGWSNDFPDGLSHTDIWARMRIRIGPDYDSSVDPFNSLLAFFGDADNGGLALQDGRLIQYTTTSGYDGTDQGPDTLVQTGDWVDLILHRSSAEGTVTHQAYVGPQGAPVALTPLTFAESGTPGVTGFNVAEQLNSAPPEYEYWIGSIEFVDSSTNPDPFGVL